MNWLFVQVWVAANDAANFMKRSSGTSSVFAEYEFRRSRQLRWTDQRPAQMRISAARAVGEVETEAPPVDQGPDFPWPLEYL